MSAPGATTEPTPPEPPPPDRQYRLLATQRIALVGLGLMGGSLALALRGQCAQITGYDPAPGVVADALARGAITHGAESFAAAVAQADLLVLAAPVRAILMLLDALPEAAPHALHVFDLGSTKAEIVARMAALPARFAPLGGHPMCGKERAGLAAADGTLFRERVFVLSPLARTPPETLALGHALVAAVGARALELDAARHDRVVAAISHLPYAAACALVAAAARTDDALTHTLAASGYRDSTRLASSDTAMMLDILLTNRPAVLACLADLQATLGELYALLEAGDPAALAAWLAATRAARITQ